MSANDHDKIRKTGFSSLSRMLPFSALLNMLNIVILTLALRGIEHFDVVKIWAVISFSIFVYFLINSVMVRRRQKKPKPRSRFHEARKKRKIIIYALTGASPWSFIACFILLYAPADIAFIAINVSVGMAAGGSVLLSTIRTAAYTYLYCIMVPLLFVLFFFSPPNMGLYSGVLGISLTLFLSLVINMLYQLNEERIKAFTDLDFTWNRIEQTTHQLRKLSSTDPLTGLLNRASFLTTIDQKRTSDPGGGEHKGAALFHIDIDNIGQVNKQHGHANADHLIERIAGDLATIFEQGDVLARVSGDEFAVYVRNVASAEAAERFSEQLVAELSNSYEVNALTIPVTVSIGAVYVTDRKMSAAALVRICENAVHIAKGAGGKCYWLHNMDDLMKAMGDKAAVA